MRALPERGQKAGHHKTPIVGETTLLSQKVIDLAGGAAEGVQGHVALSVDAPVPAVKAFAERFKKKYNYVCDHNGIKGYTAVYFVKVRDREDGQVRQQGLHQGRARHRPSRRKRSPIS